ncbi:MAG: ORF6N domain-containing protein, partial [Candidatus Binatia bacterium]
GARPVGRRAAPAHAYAKDVRITLHQGAAPGFGTTGMMGHAELVRIFGNIQKYPRRGRPVLVLYDAYGVETKALNRAHARNRERFPQDFAFQLSEKEFVDLRCQILAPQDGEGAAIDAMLSPSRGSRCYRGS